MIRVLVSFWLDCKRPWSTCHLADACQPVSPPDQFASKSSVPFAGRAGVGWLGVGREVGAVLVPLPQAASKVKSRGRASMHIHIGEGFLHMMNVSSFVNSSAVRC